MEKDQLVPIVRHTQGNVLASSALQAIKIVREAQELTEEQEAQLDLAEACVEEIVRQIEDGTFLLGGRV